MYRRLAEHAIGKKNNESYAEGAGFPAYVIEVRAVHRPKRNLMKLLDQQCW